MASQSGHLGDRIVLPGVSGMWIRGAFIGSDFVFFSSRTYFFFLRHPHLLLEHTECSGRRTTTHKEKYTNIARHSQVFFDDSTIDI